MANDLPVMSPRYAGDDTHPLYKFLTDKQANPTTGGDINWNFTKFLVGKDGNVLARYAPNVAPEALAPDIEKALAG